MPKPELVERFTPSQREAALLYLFHRTWEDVPQKDYDGRLINDQYIHMVRLKPGQRTAILHNDYQYTVFSPMETHGLFIVSQPVTRTDQLSPTRIFNEIIETNAKFILQKPGSIHQFERVTESSLSEILAANIHKANILYDRTGGNI